MSYGAPHLDPGSGKVEGNETTKNREKSNVVFLGKGTEKGVSGQKGAVRMRIYADTRTEHSRRTGKKTLFF